MNINKIKRTYHEYPGQFWLMFIGMLISTTGTSMIWPFLLIYVSERSEASLTAITSLMTINSIMSLLASFLAGPIADRFGRKWIMVLSLFMHGVVYLFFVNATHLYTFILLMAVTGTITPLYRIGSDAMMADLVPESKRINAYALLRLSNNLGISLGPAIGGFIASNSYNLAFVLAASGLAIYSMLLAFFARETLPAGGPSKDNLRQNSFGGYAHILRDGPFIKFVATFSLVSICATLIWVLMPIYAKQNFGVQERAYGLIPTTNAVMVVVLQLLITRLTRNYPTLIIAAIGAMFYGFGVGSVAMGTGFWGFWISMVIMTLGELIIVPTSSTYVANLAPQEMRGRYMSIYSLTWGLAAGIGPLLGGLLNDMFNPRAIWIGGGIAGLIGAMAFLRLYRSQSRFARKAIPVIRS